MDLLNLDVKLPVRVLVKININIIQPNNPAKKKLLGTLPMPSVLHEVRFTLALTTLRPKPQPERRESFKGPDPPTFFYLRPTSTTCDDTTP